jgi:hypothetical protein
VSDEVAHMEGECPEVGQAVPQIGQQMSVPLRNIRLGNAKMIGERIEVVKRQKRIREDGFVADHLRPRDFAVGHLDWLEFWHDPNKGICSTANIWGVPCFHKIFTHQIGRSVHLRLASPCGNMFTNGEKLTFFKPVNFEQGF